MRNIKKIRLQLKHNLRRITRRSTIYRKTAELILAIHGASSKSRNFFLYRGFGDLLRQIL